MKNALKPEQTSHVIVQCFVNLTKYCKNCNVSITKSVAALKKTTPQLSINVVDDAKHKACVVQSM